MMDLVGTFSNFDADETLTITSYLYLIPSIVRYDSDDKDDKYIAKQRANLKVKSPWTIGEWDTDYSFPTALHSSLFSV